MLLSFHKFCRKWKVTFWGLSTLFVSFYFGVTQSKVMFVIVCLCICRALSTSLVSFTVNVSALSLVTRIFITITSLLRKSMGILMFGLQNFILLKRSSCLVSNLFFAACWIQMTVVWYLCSNFLNYKL